MHVLYMHQGYFPMLAGAEWMALELADAMRERGHTVQLVCQSASGDVECRSVGSVPVLGVPAPEPRMLSDCLPWRPDIVHLVDAVQPAYPQAALALARAWSVPLAVTPASIISTWSDPPAVLRVCRAADAVFVLTQAEHEMFQHHGVARERMVVIGQGPHLRGTPDPSGFRRTHGITGPVILFLGRKVAFKGYKLLLDATARVWQQHPAAHFVFIGPRWDNDCEAIFAAYADRRIIEIGMVDEHEKHSALAACDLVCLPSIADVFPLVYVEAWACGKPVIAGPFPGAAEIVRHEQDGLIVDADPSAIAAGIMSLLSDDQKLHALGACGRARSREQFNWSVIAERTEEVYRQLVGHGHVLSV
jgi:glycosyltransferase involved in cell wall biosynthesis